ncbi:hypothetical protein WL21_06575 [Burkholderia ubonensis]|uniref:helix-turn-helix domain-containing protein n=1 Tax=Burkholderia ubonensis TaxID=101571 RepID=UPI0007521BB1|nr:helix-turn-helix domain-containing protein [Burkholderia ubonensis]KVZ56563.1 hypothetical protein WL20_03660 [Burkholderia ubonensis]KVZ72203.1 hypothetical protein WL21_06575 [Burkholderia ubonensis]
MSEPKIQDNSATAQRRITLALLKRGPRSTYELRRHGISHPAARVGELIADGHNITSARITGVDSDGFLHRNIALYELLSEPIHDCKH